jgi:hypothetical protein
MKGINRLHEKIAAALAGCTLLCSAGCDEQLTCDLVTVFSDYVGDVASSLTTEYLSGAIGIEIEAEGHTDDGDSDHSHDAEPLHEHEH